VQEAADEAGGFEGARESSDVTTVGCVFMLRSCLPSGCGSWLIPLPFELGYALVALADLAASMTGSAASMMWSRRP